MSIEAEHKVFCSGPDCELWSRVGGDTWEAGRLPVGWVRLSRYLNNGRTSEGAFHNLECVMRWCAAQEPPTAVSAD